MSNVPPSAIEEAPPDAVPFDRLDPTGCRWIYGTASATAMTCGRPRAALGLGALNTSQGCCRVANQPWNRALEAEGMT